MTSLPREREREPDRWYRYENMQLNLDPPRFDEQQLLLVRALVQTIRIKLQQAGLRDGALEEATAAIAFSVACTIDDASAIASDDAQVHPYLTFRTADGELTHCGENSYTHEFVYDVLRDRDEGRAS